MTSSLAEQPVPQPLEPPARAAWSAVLARAREDLPEASFKLWFADLGPGDLKGGVLELVAPNGYVKRWLSGHYMDLITASARQALGPNVRVHLRADPQDPGAVTSSGGRGRAKPRSSDSSQPTLDQSLGAFPFPDRYTFDTFVPGPSNRDPEGSGSECPRSGLTA